MLISIVIPTYNRRDSLIEAVATVRAQTYPHWEAIIIDDGSTDSTEEAVRGIDEPRIKYFRQENAGVSRARNEAIRRAAGEVAVFLDSDDLLQPDLLARHVVIYENWPDVGVIFSDQTKLLPNNSSVRFVPLTCAFSKEIAEIPQGGVRVFSGSEMRNALLRENIIKTPGTSVRMSELKAVGGFQEDVTVSEDWLLWLVLSEQCTFLYINECLATIRVGEDSLHLAHEERDHLYMIERLLPYMSCGRTSFERRAARQGVILQYLHLYWLYVRQVRTGEAARAAWNGWCRTKAPGLLLRAVKARLGAIWGGVS